MPGTLRRAAGRVLDEWAPSSVDQHRDVDAADPAVLDEEDRAVLAGLLRAALAQPGALERLAHHARHVRRDRLLGRADADAPGRPVPAPCRARQRDPAREEDDAQPAAVA